MAPVAARDLARWAGRRGASIARAALLAAAIAAAACSPGDDPKVVVAKIVAPTLTGESPVAATLLEDGDARAIRILPPRRGGAGGPGREHVVLDAAGEAPIGRLVLAPSRAVLHYHVASRDPGLPRGSFQPNRLAVLESDAGKRLALLLQPAPTAARTAGVADLDLEEGARIVALAQSLGAWSALARDRYPLDAEGQPALPFFVPEAPGNWRALAQRSLAFFMPAPVARHVSQTPGFRSRQYRQLAEFSARLPEIAAAAESLSAALDAPDLVAEVAALRELLSQSRDAFEGYLDSTWIEVDLRVRLPDTARIALYVHSVADVVVDTLGLDLPHKLLVVESKALAALRLRTPDGDVFRPHLGQDRLEFRLDREVAPRPLGPYGFAGVRLDLELSGLARLEDRRWPLLEQLRVGATNRVTGSAVPAAHVSSLLSLEDPRFALGAEQDVADFLTAQRRILERADGGDRLLELDRGAKSFALAEGVYQLKDDLVLPADHGLVLAAGVELRIHPGKSLLVRGPLEVRGSAERPVRIRGVSLAAPWGVLAVQGRGRSSLRAQPPRSEIRHLELSGGSEDSLKGVFYSGQLSVHHQDLLLEHATLSHASADDSLNVKHGEVAIRDSVFVDNAGDAVDLDWASGDVQRSFFGRSGSGGDGIDVSGSEVAVADCVFSDLRDKCLSVGERSTLHLSGSLLRACETGVASKDGSSVEVQRSVLLDNERNFAAYRKKAIFGGGRLRGEALILGAAAKADSRGPDSQLELVGVAPLASSDAERLRGDSAFSARAFAGLVGGSE